MRWFYTVIILAMMLSPLPESVAGEIYKWTDDNGVVVITNLPPPKGVAAPQVVSYPDHAAESTQSESPEQNKALEAARQANAQLAQARQEAEAAQLQAKETAETAAEYNDKTFARKRKKRIVQQRRARRSAEAAGKSEAALLEAQEKVAQAEAAAIAAEKRIRVSENGADEGQNIETGLPKGP